VPTDPNVPERLLFHRLNGGPAFIFDPFGAGRFEAVSLTLDVGVVVDRR
jgi:hypothetical protein